MKIKKSSIKCSECNYCSGLRPPTSTRTSFFCDHPDQQYIHHFFVKKRMRKMPGFLAFGTVYSDTVPLKTSPAWCPKKK